MLRTKLRNLQAAITHIYDVLLDTLHLVAEDDGVAGYERLTKACELAHAANVHIILKGAYSAIITPAGKCYFNPTGNPGMATGGSGDVLTGVILALLAQGYPAEDAAKIGTYIHGLAGDFAQKKQGMIGLIASDIITCLPTAWRLVSE